MAQSGKRSPVFLIIAILVIIVLWAIRVNNNLVTEEEKVDAQWANVENVYQRRADLIPNLVNTVKGYAAHEKETLEGVINARAKATSTTIEAGGLTPDAMQQFQAAQGSLTQALGKLMVVVERYPDLKANQNFLELQAQLEGTENRISTERMRFNETARTYNTMKKKFPKSAIAGLLGFENKPYFEAAEGSDVAPTVEF